ncbi:MAG: FMN-binding protein [Candidatus Omnitrophota bacterium]|nr:FMN-binding protein [Candidatus Omnitrophota bacterium]MBU3929341.1 FMN-binding protein [bacterium]MBU4122456.1 FMN-binding protein [bacterium]
MKKIVKISLFLLCLCFASGLILSFVWEKSSKKIDENEKRAKTEAVEELFPGEEISALSLDGEEYWQAGSAGYAFEASIMGFQDEIRAVVGVGKNMDRIKGIIILKCLETPGLGAEVTKDKFLKQFNGKNAPFSIVKTAPREKYDIQAVTGATISSRAVVKMINEKMMKMKAVIR